MLIHCPNVLIGSVIVALSLGGAASLSPVRAADSTALTPYTTPDKSASAGVPAGWHVVRGDSTVIGMTGPNGEKISLGVTAIAKSAPANSAKPPSGIAFNLPYATRIDQKFLAVWKFASSSHGAAAPDFTITSGTPMHVPAILGQCARLYGSVVDASKVPAKFESVICSLPVDFGGAYKNVLLYAQVPATLAAQERSLAEAVMSSYRIPQQMLAKKLGPFYATPKLAAAGGGSSMSSIWASQNASQTASDCFDLTVLRETPQYQLPAKCGGPASNR